jgi:hypothetical protein
MPAGIEWYLDKSYDPLSGHLIFLGHTEHEVHKGELFMAEHSDNVANGNSLEMMITTSTSPTHFAVSVAAGGQVTVYLFEGTAKTAGTGITPRNFNRTKSDATSVVVAHTPGGAGDGTAIINGRLVPGGATVQTRVGASARSGTELILKASTKYLLRVTNTSGGAIDINPSIVFYDS